MKKYKSLFLSDIHLGSSHCNSEEFFKLIENIDIENLFLVGDIFSITASKDNTDVKRFLKLINSSRWNITYILGNHEKERKYALIELKQNNQVIEPLEEYIYKQSKQNIYLTHGDKFHDKDIFNKLLKKALIYIKRRAKKHISKKLNPDKSVSSTIYHIKVKPIAQKLLHDSYVKYLSKEALKRDCKTVICGHIHLPEELKISNTKYLNCGDWVNNNSYIVEDFSENLVLINL